MDKPLHVAPEATRQSQSGIFGTGKPRDEGVVEATRSRNTSESSQNWVGGSRVLVSWWVELFVAWFNIYLKK